MRIQQSLSLGIALVLAGNWIRYVTSLAGWLPLLLVCIPLMGHSQDIHLRGNTRNQEAASIPQTCIPPAYPMRTMAEWEEVEYVVVTWTQFLPVLREIVRYAQQECKVLIVCTDSLAVKADLQHHGIPLIGVEYVLHPYNSVWIRDYGPNSVYERGTDSLMLLDWIYNRPRPLDDHISEAIAEHLGLPYKSMSCPPYDLVHIGGNFITDGMGTAISTRLVLGENYTRNAFNGSPKTESHIDQMMRVFMGISHYIKLPSLPYDAIHHIDMHMQFLNEETLLVGQYPEHTADGPQIEENIATLQQQVLSAFGTPYRIVRIPMPAFRGHYPDSGKSPYLTHTNIVFINRTVLVPIYGGPSDSVALRIIRRELPGYKVVGINCQPIIMAGGALHCITRTIGVRKPLRITHQPVRSLIPDGNPARILAHITHAEDIAWARLWYATDPDSGFFPIHMKCIDTETDLWQGWLPPPSPNQNLYYFIEAQSRSGKTQRCPISAPLGYWRIIVANPHHRPFSLPVPDESW